MISKEEALEELRSRSKELSMDFEDLKVAYEDFLEGADLLEESPSVSSNFTKYALFLIVDAEVRNPFIYFSRELIVRMALDSFLIGYVRGLRAAKVKKLVG